MQSRDIATNRQRAPTVFVDIIHDRGQAWLDTAMLEE
jgi:hypothetical protein